MEIGIFSRTYETGTLEDTFRSMSLLGIRHTQFNLSNAEIATLPETVDSSTLETIHMLREAYGIIIDALSGTYNMIDPDEEKRKAGCMQFKTQCEIARQLKIPIVSVCTGSKNPDSKWKWHEDNKKQSSWDELLQSMDIIIPYAEENNIVIGVEPEVSNIIFSAERARKLLDQMNCKNVKIIIDGANLFHAEEVSEMRKMLEEAFEMLGKDIVLAHAKDLLVEAGKLKYVAAGKGVLDFSYYLELLQNINYQGALVMHGLTTEEISVSKNFLEKVIAHATI